MNMADAHRCSADGTDARLSTGTGRLPKLQAAGLILVMSLAVWGVIGLGVSVVVG